MKEPRRRKLFWIVTGGFTWPEYPNDDAIFRAEEAAGLIYDTNVQDSEEEDELPLPGSLYSLLYLKQWLIF